ncbi:NrdH-redoxin [Candidatus Kaiserbacteria bacterium RIFCSPLOWO2_12_FULL_53_8]|uniref:NrdH-redoxin n=2 Tax=Candidatus Kaiseribacteriota TaxID=1752734 RepID=A0A1F6CWK5_9BACT|nr:MAG: NrdH-redoxin [Candidatus Kaiserbacteria bacterium RIFCSPHIGHO2_01_FULL_53_29]OGG91463.1 MAG: NrdH-redoxin [Candidatus Kaiserbacteria bacterium RIFCSPLOWO2_12_FULL_53_8]
MAKKAQVSIYTTPTCHFCHAAKEFFTASGVNYTEYNVASDLERRKDMIEKSGQMGVPVITVDNDLVVGFDEPKLRELLAV